MKIFNPKLMGMRAGMLVFLYRRRLRAHPVQELLAAAGIAVGVALVVGVLVANTSLTSSARELVSGLTGSARLQLATRSPAGMPEALVEKARQLPGVQAATPVLRQSATIVGPSGRERVQLIGVAPSLASLGGLVTEQLQHGASLVAHGLGLPASVAAATGARLHSQVSVLSGGGAQSTSMRLRVGGSGALGVVADSPVAIATLPVAQRLLGRQGRVTQILVEPRPGMESQARASLRRLSAGRLDVSSAQNELRLLSQATEPNRQSTSLFSAISVMVGFLLALNAMLLTMPERRRFIAELRMQGYAPRQVLLLLGFEAVALGVVASAAGVLLGGLLSRALFQQVPAYLSSAFPLGAHQSIHAGTVLAAIGCGVLATVLASISPALDLRPGLAPDAVFREPAGGGGEAIGGRTVLRCALAGTALIALVGVLAAAVPSLTLPGGVVLALATLLLMPAALTALAQMLPWATRHTRSGAVVVAVAELRAITARSVGLAGIAALAVYGCVAIGGTRQDLLRGIDTAIEQYHSPADVWVTAGQDVFNTDSFKLGSLASRLARVPAIGSVRVYRGGLTDIGSRRLWVRARPPGDSVMVEPSQILAGDSARAQRLLRAGGWVAVSSTFAREGALKLGGTLRLPTPAGSQSLRVAAITTNSGWPAGTITLSGADYRRWWGSGEASALELNVRAGMEPQAATRQVRAALAAYPGLDAQTGHQRALQAQASARQGLRTLGQISSLLLIAAALAVASALSAAVWQRRARLASLKIQGYDPGQLWRGLLLESAAMLGIGSVLGALVGVLGHALASRWLVHTTGFPAPFAIGAQQVFLTLALVTAIALTVITLPGAAAARVAPRLSLQE